MIQGVVEIMVNKKMPNTIHAIQNIQKGLCWPRKRNAQPAQALVCNLLSSKYMLHSDRLSPTTQKMQNLNVS